MKNFILSLREKIEKLLLAFLIIVVMIALTSSLTIHFIVPNNAWYNFKTLELSKILTQVNLGDDELVFLNNKGQEVKSPAKKIVDFASKSDWVKEDNNLVFVSLISGIFATAILYSMFLHGRISDIRSSIYIPIKKIAFLFFYIKSAIHDFFFKYTPPEISKTEIKVEPVKVQQEIKPEPVKPVSVIKQEVKPIPVIPVPEIKTETAKPAPRVRIKLD